MTGLLCVGGDITTKMKCCTVGTDTRQDSYQDRSKDPPPTVGRAVDTTMKTKTGPSLFLSRESTYVSERRVRLTTAVVEFLEELHPFETDCLQTGTGNSEP